MVFSLAHEIAHAYLVSIGKKYAKKHQKKEEYDADGIVYHIVLKIIIQEDSVLEKYTYLAPMIYMNFFDLYYYTDRVLYKTFHSKWKHPLPVKRKKDYLQLQIKMSTILTRWMGIICIVVSWMCMMSTKISY